MNIKKGLGHRQGKRKVLPSGDRYRQAIQQLFVDGIRLTNADAIGISRILTASGIDHVFIGGIIVGCHTGRPRATQDVDVIVGNKIPAKVEKLLGSLVKAKKLERHPSFISFLVKTPLGDREVIDLITSRAGSYGAALENTITFEVDKNKIKIPTAEMMIVLKYTAAVNPIREKSKQLQDWADLFAIVDANPKLNLYTIEFIADSIVPGWGEDLRTRIKKHRI